MKIKLFLLISILLLVGCGDGNDGALPPPSSDAEWDNFNWDNADWQ